MAGAFGNYIRKTSAIRLGLLPAIDAERVRFVGNAAGVGARLALVDREILERARELAARTEYVDSGHRRPLPGGVHVGVGSPSVRRAQPSADDPEGLPMINFLDLAPRGPSSATVPWAPNSSAPACRSASAATAGRSRIPTGCAAIHAAYIAAGSEAIITNSFGANRWVLGRYGLATASWRRQPRCGRDRARGGGVTGCVLGDIGPCGGFLRPLGDVEPDALLAEFTAPGRALLDGGADGIIIETMSALEELLIAIRAARAAGRAVHRRLDGVRSASQRQHPDDDGRRAREGGRRLRRGRRRHRRRQLRHAHDARPTSPAVVAAFRQVTDRPIMVQANAGSPELEDGRAVYRLTPEVFADGMSEVVAGRCRDRGRVLRNDAGAHRRARAAGQAGGV